MKRKYLHDLDYFKSIIESLEEAKTVLTFLFLKKSKECIWYSYDSQASEAFCDHKEVWKEIVDLEDCAKCSHFQIREKKEIVIGKINEMSETTLFRRAIREKKEIDLIHTQKICPFCGGTGKIKYPDTDDDVTCHKCQGTGKIRWTNDLLFDELTPVRSIQKGTENGRERK